jgi:hypothetical protein
VGLTIVGDRSVKACLDIDWDDQQAQRLALRKLVHEAQQLERWLEEQSVDLKNDAQVRGAIDTLRKVIGQDTEPDPDGSGIRVKQGVAPDRQISLSDPDMRHGRKSSAQRIDGYKRYAACDLDSGLTLAAGVLPANVPEHVGADKLRSEIEEHGKVDELHQDRAFLPSELTQDVYASGDSVIAKPYSNANGELFSKQQFDVNLQAGTVECPAGNSAPIVGDRAKFSAKKCAACPLRSQCQKETARDGRTIAIQSNEAMLQQLHQQVGTTTGRQKLRERVKIEHKLAHHCRVQGPRARYRGTRNNDFDARRTATVTNLAVLAARYPAGLERAA